MKQVLITSGGAIVGETPQPHPVAGEVLVEVHYSCISPGTEGAALKPAPPPDREAASAPTGIAVRAARVATLGFKAITKPKRALAVGRALLASGRAGEVLSDHLGTGQALDQRLPLGGAGAEQQAFAVGYSASGLVRAVGPGVGGFIPGDRVACAGAGKANHAELIAVPRNLVCLVPQEVGLREACTVSLGAIALQGVRRADCRIGELVLVIGLGFLGQLTLALLRASGTRCIGYDTDESQVQLAIGRGFAECTALASELSRWVDVRTAGHGVDATIITAGTTSDLPCQQAMLLTRRRGRVVVVGDVGLGLERSPFYAKEIDFLISCSYGPGRYDPLYEEGGGDYPRAHVRWTAGRNLGCFLDLIAGGDIDLAPLLTCEYGLDDAAAAYAALLVRPRPPTILLRYPAVDAAKTSRIAASTPRSGAQGAYGLVLVGAGAFARGLLLPQFRKQTGIHWQGVLSSRGIEARNLANSECIPNVYSSIDEALADPAVHGLVVATRHHLHAEQTARALIAGKSVFCEKPIAIDWAGLEQVEEAIASAATPRLMVGFNRRFSPPFLALAKALGARRQPMVAHYRVNAGRLPMDHWLNRGDGGGRNLGEACHFYDLFGALTGSAPTALAACGIGQGARADENFNAMIRFADGSVCSLIYTSLGDAGLGKERLEVHCEGASYLLDDFCRLTRWADGRSEILWQGKPGAVDKGHEEEISRWCAFLTNGGVTPLAWTSIRQATAIGLQVQECLLGQAERFSCGSDGIAHEGTSSCAD